MVATKDNSRQDITGVTPPEQEVEERWDSGLVENEAHAYGTIISFRDWSLSFEAGGSAGTGGEAGVVFISF